MFSSYAYDADTRVDTIGLQYKMYTRNVIDANPSHFISIIQSKINENKGVDLAQTMRLSNMLLGWCRKRTEQASLLILMTSNEV